jgi:hypothetical protein
MSVREALNAPKKAVGIGFGIGFILLAVAILIYTQLPQHRIKGDKTFFTTDDGQTWFLDSVYRTPPFDYNGGTAVRAVIYSYDQGDKTYCAYLMRYTDSAKKRLDDAIADAVRQGKSPGSVSLFSDRDLNSSGVEIKLPGPGNRWTLQDSENGAQIMNTGISAHADSSSDLVIPE